MAIMGTLMGAAGMKPYVLTCSKCHKTFTIMLTEKEFARIESGESLSEALTTRSPIIVSQLEERLCDGCFKEQYKEETT